MRRTLLAGLALTLSTAGLGLMTTTSGTAAGDKVTAADLPTVAEVAPLYPALAGGSRDVYRSRTVDLLTDECIFLVTVAKAASGKWTSYYDAQGDLIYFEGKADPTVFVYKFDKAKQAASALTKVRQQTRPCEGLRTFDDGTRIRRTLDRTPRIASEKAFTILTYRRTPNSITTWSYKRDVDVWARKGRYLVNTVIQKESSMPALDKAITLTRRTVADLG